MDDESIDAWIAVFAVASLVFAGITFFASLIISVVFAAAYHEVQSNLLILVSAILFFVLLLTVLYLFAGIGVLKRKRWARTVGLVTSAISLLSFPFGTAYGVLGIWLFGFEKDAIKRFVK